MIFSPENNGLLVSRIFPTYSIASSSTTDDDFDSTFKSEPQSTSSPIKTTQGKGLKTLRPKQLLHRLSMLLVQGKADNTSEKFLNEIKQTVYSIYREKS